MTFFGSSDSGGHAVRRSYNALRTSSCLASRPYIANPTFRMTATPPRANRLWHPSRGISFSPSPASPVSPAQSPRAVIDVSVGLGGNHVAPSQSTDALNEVWGAATISREASARRAQSTPPDLNLPRPTEPAANLDVSVQISAGIDAKANEEEEEAEAEVEIEAEGETNEAERKATDDPPPAVLEYKMVDEMFYAAKKSPPGSPESFWSYAQYRRTAEDGSLRKVSVHYCRSRHTMERVCKQYFMDEKVLGFDLEWMADSTKRDGLKKNVSLIQLASPSRIALFHVAVFTDSEDMVGPSFRSLMENPDILKVGVSVKGDTTRLRNFLDIDSRGLMELSHLYKLVTHSRSGQYHNINRRLVPLATQVEEFLHLPLFKGQSVRSSDWSRPLNFDQILYSASDAYAGLQLYLTLDHHRRQLDPCPPPPHRAELNLAIRLADGVKVTRPKETLEAEDGALVDGGVSGSSNKATATDGVSIENDETALFIPVPAKAKASSVSKEKSASTSSTPKVPERPKDSRVEVAEDRVASYRTSHPQCRTSFAQLRAYFLWHCYDLSPASIAQLLRDPPLKTITVVQYIISAVQSERLPVDRDRLREIADFIPQSTLWGRWPVVAGMVAAPDG
ncbi:ribonuclease H-like protein [Xylaria sp. FL0043]|nr:ribonuclease H-like protein [Xylaria sp. FL0043]